MNKKKILLSLSLTSLLYADVGNITFKNGLVEVEVTQTYNMGDRDSKMDAFRYASEVAKVEASEAAGTYIESNFELIEQQTNGTNHTKTAKRTLKTLSASVMRFTVTNEELKHPTLTLKAKAVVDTKALQQKIAQNEALQQKEQEVDKLTKHNKKLLEEIQALNIQIPNITTTSQAFALIQKRNELLGKMEQNGNELKVTLNVKGMKEAYQEEVEQEKIKQQTLLGYYQLIKQAMKPKIHTVRQGNQVTIEYGYDIDISLLPFIETKMKEGTCECSFRVTSFRQGTFTGSAQASNNRYFTPDMFKHYNYNKHMFNNLRDEGIVKAVEYCNDNKGKTVSIEHGYDRFSQQCFGERFSHLELNNIAKNYFSMTRTSYTEIKPLFKTDYKISLTLVDKNNKTIDKVYLDKIYFFNDKVSKKAVSLSTISDEIRVIVEVEKI